MEERLRAYDETSVSSTESMADLRRELARFKEAEIQSSKYIVDLEARLSRADESILSLQQAVEESEKECERRQAQVETIQSRLESFKLDGENWRSDLEAREAKVKQLEEKMREWEQRRKETEETRFRLGGVVGEVELAKRHLEIDISKSSSTVSSVSPSPGSEYPPPMPLQADSHDAVGATDTELEKQFLELQQTHTATLADLASITGKYRDALREISDLAAQIQETKFSNPSIAEVADITTESHMVDILPDTPPLRKRILGPRIWESSEGQLSPRRHFFRQAASAESLHTRSLSQSQSLSQELSSVHSRKESSSAGSSHSPSSSHSVPHGLRPNLSISFSPVGGERSVYSLEKEIMRLQEVLRDREAEITVLERSVKESQQQQQQTAKSIVVNGIDDELKHFDNAGEVNGTNLGIELSPKTLNRFESIRKTMENGIVEAPALQSEDESLERLNELML